MTGPMTSFDLHLLRHGAPMLSGRMMGRTDCAPSPDGVAACVARAADVPVEAILSSNLARAETPARAIADARALPLAIDPRWRELDFGQWDGLAANEIDSKGLSDFYNDPDAHAPPGGERWSTLLARVGAALDALPHRPTLILTHGGAMRAALAHLCGFTQAQLWAFDLPYAALLSLRIWPGERMTAQIMGLST
jgi:alpha-ribazole phosphatase